jgi:putative oxidoreductase
VALQKLGKYAPWGLTILRLALGITFLIHGYQKWFIYGISGVEKGFTAAGIPIPGISAIVVATVEFVGGLLLILGLFTRYAAILLAIVMFVAMTQVHLAAGFFLPKGYEYTFNLLAALIAILLGGPGAAALDRRR